MTALVRAFSNSRIFSTKYVVADRHEVSATGVGRPLPVVAVAITIEIGGPPVVPFDADHAIWNRPSWTVP